jgi:hypothetical protein
MALYEIAGQQANATVWAAKVGGIFRARNSWVHAYNKGGPSALHLPRGWLDSFSAERGR